MVGSNLPVVAREDMEGGGVIALLLPHIHISTQLLETKSCWFKQ